MTDEVEEFLAHFGVKGMKWGQRRANRKASFKELREVQKKNAASEKKASKNPTFKREVEAYKKGNGIRIKNMEAEFTKGGELLTGRTLGEFRNSKGQKVSEDFANAVINKVGKARYRNHRIRAAVVPIGSLFVATYLTTRK